MAASSAAADTGAAGPAVESNSRGSAARSVNWPLWYVLPIAPYQKRKTLMTEIVPGKVSDGWKKDTNRRAYCCIVIAVFIGVRRHLENDKMTNASELIFAVQHRASS